MKLINPTDDELSSTFAVAIAGWLVSNGGPVGVGPYTWYAEEDGVTVERPKPNFARSADAVLPWLEKRYIETEIKSWWDSPAQHYNESSRQGHRVFEPNGVWTIRIPGSNAMAEDKSFAKAACIALLRAHGVEIEFTS